VPPSCSLATPCCKISREMPMQQAHLCPGWPAAQRPAVHGPHRRCASRQRWSRSCGAPPQGCRTTGACLQPTRPHVREVVVLTRWVCAAHPPSSVFAVDHTLCVLFGVRSDLCPGCAACQACASCVQRPAGYAVRRCRTTSGQPPVSAVATHEEYLAMAMAIPRVLRSRREQAHNDIATVSSAIRRTSLHMQVAPWRRFRRHWSR
jgi:hypothetical protein